MPILCNQNSKICNFNEACLYLNCFLFLWLKCHHTTSSRVTRAFGIDCQQGSVLHTTKGNLKRTWLLSTALWDIICHYVKQNNSMNLGQKAWSRMLSLLSTVCHLGIVYNSSAEFARRPQDRCALQSTLIPLFLWIQAACSPHKEVSLPPMCRSWAHTDTGIYSRHNEQEHAREDDQDIEILPKLYWCFCSRLWLVTT